MLTGTATVEGKHLLKKLNLGCSAGPSFALGVIAKSRDSKGYLIALFTTATRWKQHKCLAMNEYIKQILTHTYTPRETSLGFKTKGNLKNRDEISSVKVKC